MTIKLFSLLIFTVGLANTAMAQDRNYSNRDRDFQNRDRDYNQQQNYPDRDRDNRDNRDDDRYDNRNNNNYDVYARCDNNRYGNYDFDRRNPFDTRSPNYDPRNPFDPRPVYDPYRHSRWNEIDFRSNADPFDFCDSRRAWASRYYPLDPRNPYDIRNRYQERVVYRGVRRPSRPVIVVTVPIFGRGHGHHRGRDW
ncbi:hypothetical protein [Arcicella lustrica]|uniref:Secreted protein n=1 Tax=Arcicella lustrica TaxID=2984196 RepID=A0ABU5SID3_9BACT|nr:hypothetical protein [Arcicella sp. DC25W]MEA5427024.1 hypothetical protein [Arcicella sp. DC25W]